MSHKDKAQRAIVERAPDLISLSHNIHRHPELAFEERYASKVTADLLSSAGFAVEEGVAGLPTAFRAESGAGSMRIVVCAEYDALPEIGHACGHNVVAASAVGAGIGMASVADDLDIEVVVLGTPAEESGGGKIRLLEAGEFDGASIAMMVHPAPYDVVAPPVLALRWLDIEYRGKAAHAAAFPEEGINAADASLVAQMAIGLARQHLRPDVRVHGISTEAGVAPNIIPDLARLRYMVRAATMESLAQALDRVERCLRAGETATGALLQIASGGATYKNLIHNEMVGQMYKANAEALGRVFDDRLVPPVSTDMGNISHKIPTIHPFIGISSLPSVNHQKGFTEAAGAPAADKAAIDGATSLAWTAIDAAEPARRSEVEAHASQLLKGQDR